MRIFLSRQSGARPIELLTAVHILLTGNTASVEAAGLGETIFRGRWKQKLKPNRRG
jgi:hypothetical protein